MLKCSIPELCTTKITGSEQALQYFGSVLFINEFTCTIKLPDSKRNKSSFLELLAPPSAKKNMTKRVIASVFIWLMAFFGESQFLKTMKSHCAFRIITVDNFGKIWNYLEWNGFQSWFEILMKSKTNILVENNEIWSEWDETRWDRASAKCWIIECRAGISSI